MVTLIYLWIVPW